jgi:hypothetical protein
LNKKIIGIMIISILAISTLAMLTPKVAATGEYQFGSMSIDDTSFLRCYDYTYEQAHDGRSSNDVYDTAWITASIPAYAMDHDTHLQARLLKCLTVDGYTVHNGYWSPDSLGIGFTNGVIWVNTQEFDYYDWMGADNINFAYDLNWNSIYYGYDIFPNYWTPDDFANDLSGHGWARHSFEVTFAIEWWEQNWWGGWDKIGATQDIPDESHVGPLVGCVTSHTDNGWESWTFMIPNDEIHFACSTQWTNVYGSASISYPYEAQYRTPDTNYATFLAASSGATARACYWIGGPCSGTVYIYGDSMNSPFSRFLVYVSSDNYNWRLSSEQLVYNQADRWIDCGTPSGTYQYVLVIAYDAVSTSYMKINCINCGGRY